MKDLVEIIPNYDEKLGNMNASLLAARDAESAGYAHYMAKMLAASDAQREENKKLAEIRRIRRGIDPTAQQPSTMATLARPKEQDFEHFLRPLPQSVIDQSAKLTVAIQSGDEDAIKTLTAERKVSLEEVSHVEATRRRPKNSIGQSQKSGTTEEKKEAAVHSILYSPGVKFEDLSPFDRQRVIKPMAYETEILVAEDALPKEPDKDLFWKHGQFFELKNWIKRFFK